MKNLSYQDILEAKETLDKYRESQFYLIFPSITKDPKHPLYEIAKKAVEDGYAYYCEHLESDSFLKIKANT